MSKRGYTTIPNKIKYDNNLTLLSRLILADIIGFNDDDLLIFKSNKSWADDYGVSIRTIENTINELRTHRYIITQYHPRKHQRIIHPTSKCNYDYEKDILRAKKEGYKDDTEKENEPQKTTLIKDLKKIWT